MTARRSPEVALSSVFRSYDVYGPSVNLPALKTKVLIRMKQQCLVAYSKKLFRNKLRRHAHISKIYEIKPDYGER